MILGPKLPTPAANARVVVCGRRDIAIIEGIGEIGQTIVATG
jgi:hypothetical protein